jgi:hypothetical protein
MRFLKKESISGLPKVHRDKTLVIFQLLKHPAYRVYQIHFLSSSHPICIRKKRRRRNRAETPF